MKFLKFLGVACFVASLTVVDASAAGQKRHDLIDVAEKAGNFKTLISAVKAAGLESDLRSAGPFTLFAPTDKAFAKLPKGALHELLADRILLKSVILYHVVDREMYSAQAISVAKSQDTNVMTANGVNLQLTIKNGLLYVDHAEVVVADVKASNGVMHEINDVLIP
jgi:uncharacterized surface protein with fasciclin (FAS1) repeats